MASSVFEGTSLVNMFVRDCWVNGVRRLVVSQRGEEEEFFEIRTEWSDRNVLYLHRSSSDLGRLLERLAEASPEDRGDLATSPLREGLVKIREASDIELKLNEVEILLKSAINLPWKFSRSEVMLTFFERSPLDQLLRNDKEQRFQNPLHLSEILRSNGFCLANTETIALDQTPSDLERPSSTDSEEHTYDDGGFLAPDLEACGEEAEAYHTNLSYYHLVPFETDLLE